MVLAGLLFLVSLPRRIAKFTCQRYLGDNQRADGIMREIRMLTEFSSKTDLESGPAPLNGTMGASFEDSDRNTPYLTGFSSHLTFHSARQTRKTEKALDLSPLPHPSPGPFSGVYGFISEAMVSLMPAPRVEE